MPDTFTANINLPPQTRVIANFMQARDAYQIALAEGFIGTRAEWLASLQGLPATGGTGTALGPDDNFVTAAEKAALHAAATVSGPGISISGQQVSLEIGTGAAQVAAGNHTHAGVYDPAGSAAAAKSAAIAASEAVGTAASAVAAHAIAPDPHGDRAYAAGLGGNYATAAQGSLAATSVQLAGEQTVAGAKTLTGQLTLTGQSAADANSAMTQGLVDSKYMLDMHRKSLQRIGLRVPTLSGSGGVSSTLGDGAILSIAGAAAGSYRVASFGSLVMPIWTGIWPTFSRPFNASGVLYLRALTENRERVRVLLGPPISYVSGVSAFSANGVGIEIMNNGGTYLQARLIYFSGTYKTSAWVNTLITSANPQYCVTGFLMTSNGAGGYSLYLTTCNYSGAAYWPAISTSAALITITDGPTTAANGVTYTAGLGTTAAAAAGPAAEMLVQNFLFHYF